MLDGLLSYGAEEMEKEKTFVSLYLHQVSYHIFTLSQLWNYLLCMIEVSCNMKGT